MHPINLGHSDIYVVQMQRSLAKNKEGPKKIPEEANENPRQRVR